MSLHEINSTETFMQDIHTEALKKGLSAGEREKSDEFKIAGECRKALGKLPEDSRGLVLGSGPNTKNWQEKGWQTLDIDEQHDADYTGDANKLAELVPPNSLDFIYAEALAMDYYEQKGVNAKKLIQQAQMTLKPGGKLIISSAHKENRANSTLPHKTWVANELKKTGFKGVVEIGDMREITQPNGSVFKEQGVVYYAEKLPQK